MATFDFLGVGIQSRGSNAFLHNGSTTFLTFTETEAGQTVRFTFSVTDTPATHYSMSHFGTVGRITLTNGTPFDGTDVFTLSVQDTAVAANDLLTGGTNGNVTVKAYPGPTIRGTWNVAFHGTKAVVNQDLKGATKTAVAATSVSGGITKIVFTSSSGNARLFLGQINANVACFLTGTAIATPEGSVPVEELKPGDIVLTAAGGTTTVAWLGVQPIGTRLSHPRKVNPIRITADALADRVPARDLMLSADHAIAIDGLLINAGALVNGTTIYQVRDMPLDGFTYYHVETEGGHELILAEGVAAETFIDYAGRDSFVNGDERSGAATIPEMDMPRISAARLVPPELRQSIAMRAQALTARRVA